MPIRSTGWAHARHGTPVRSDDHLAPGADRERADALHHEAHEKCFVSQSVNFPVTVEATYRDE